MRRGAGKGAIAGEQAVPRQRAVIARDALTGDLGCKVSAREPACHDRLERVRQAIVGGGVAPIGRVGAAVHAVMRDDIVADAVIARGDAGVEVGAVLRREAARGPGADEAFDRRLHDMQRGRLERLDEALREPDRQAVADPALGDAADLHRQVPHRSRVADAEMRAQIALGFVARAIARGVDIAVARPAGQRNVPHPAVAERGRARRGGGAARIGRGRHYHRAVVEEVFAERAEGHAERGLVDRRAEPAGVDEQVARDPLAALGEEVRDRSLGDRDLDDAALEMDHALPDRVIAQEGADQMRIEMIAVGRPERKMFGRDRRPPRRREPRRQEEAIGMRPDVLPVPPPPRRIEKGGRGVEIERPGKGMEIAFEARPVRPAVKGDAVLVGGVARRHPFGFGDAERLEECLQLRRRAFADTDDADVGAFDHRHLRATRPGVGEQVRRHPPRRPAAEDDDPARPRPGLRHRSSQPRMSSIRAAQAFSSCAAPG